MAFLEQVRRSARSTPRSRRSIATHKGFALPGFDQRAAAPRDVGPAAQANPDVRFIVYHSGYDIGDTPGALRRTTPNAPDRRRTRSTR